MAISTPRDLSIQEKAREDELRHKIKSSLETEVEFAMRNGKVTSAGGEFCLTGFQKENMGLVNDYLGQFGWKAEYAPYQDSWWSMTAKSESYYTVHRFYVKPREK